MSNAWFTSDLHWGHKAITKYQSEFSSEEERREIVKDNIASSVKKRDLLWILGDSVFTEDALKDLDAIKCTKFLVVGNHCAQNTDSWKLYEKFERVFGVTKRYGCWIQHTPIHPQELFGKFCLHGHSHRKLMELTLPSGEVIIDPRYICMCLEFHDYKPRDIKWLKHTMEERKVLIERYKL